MPQICNARMTAQIDDEVVVFLIGMRINRMWKFHKWLPVARAMPRMLRELSASRDSGFLGFHQWFGNPTIAVQYWRSFEHLERYAKDPGSSHRPAWAAFNRAVASNADVGIWHEPIVSDPAISNASTTTCRSLVSRAPRTRCLRKDTANQLVRECGPSLSGLAVNAA